MSAQSEFRILVVDDEPSTIEFISALLQKHGHRVDGVRTGREAVERAVAVDYDLILCDLKLPDIPGTEVLEHIKRAKSDAVVVILTGYASLPSALRAIELGAYDYLDKRAGGSQILHRVQRALEYSRVQRELNDRQRNLELLTRFAYEVSRSLDLGEVLDAALPLIQSATASDAVLLYAREEEDQTYHLVRDVHVPTRLRRLAKVRWRDIPLQTGEFVKLSELSRSESLSAKERRRWRRLQSEFTTIFVQPLEYGEKTVGTIVACYRSEPQRQRATGELLRGMAHHLALVLNNARLHTEAQQLLRSLRESEQKYRGLFENSREGICLIVNGTIRIVNRALCDMLGYEQDEIVGQPFTAVIHPDDAPEMVRRYYRRLRGFPEPTRYEARLVRKDSALVDVECEISVVDFDGDRGIQVFIRDITERKRSYRKLQQRNRELVALAEVARATSQSLDVDQVLQNGLRAAMRVVRADMGKIYLLDPRTNDLHLATCLGEEGAWWKVSPIPADAYFSGKSVAQERPVHITDSHAAEAVAVDPELARAPRCSFLAVPILHGGRPLGAMNLGRKIPGGFSKEEEGLVRAVASTLALGIANSQAHLRTVEQVQRLNLLQSYTFLLAQAAGTQQAARYLVEGAQRLSGADQAVIALRKGPSETVFRVVAYSKDGQTVTPKAPQHWTPEAVLLERLATGKVYVVEDSAENGAPFPSCSDTPRLLAAVPIEVGASLEGILLLGCREHAFDEEELLTVQMLARHAGEAIQRSRLLDALSRSEQRFRRVFDIAPDALLLLGNGGKILEANLHALELLGLVPTALIGKRLQDFLISDHDVDAVEEALKRAPSAGHFLRECFIRAGNGARTPVELRIVSFPSGSEGGWLALLHDLSRYKAYEEALRREKEFSERVIENAGVLIIGGRDDGTLAICNRKVAEVTGFEQAQLRDGEWRRLFWPEHLEESSEAREWEKWVTCKDGQRRCLHFTETELTDETGQRVGVIAFGQDLTQLRNMQAQLVQTEKLAALGQLISGVAHEINNPLTGIMGYTQLLLASDTDPSIRKDLEVIYKEAERCKKIVSNLLRFARGEKSEKHPLDLNDIVRSVVELKEYMLRVDGVDLKLSLKQDLPPVCGNETELQQLVLNLLTNAHQAFPPHQKGKRIILETRHTKGDVVLRVEDNGPGIPPSVVEKIWDPFFTTKEVGKGSGLGLSVCMGIVRDHGGDIKLVQTGPEGTIFEVRLPAASEQGRGTQLTDSHETPGEHGDVRLPQDMGKRRVLVVDDEQTVSAVLRRVLARMGFEAECVSDGLQALESIHARDYDLVFCDIKMPNMSGVELVRRIQQEKRELANRVIMMSGDLLNPETEMFLKEFRGPVLKKPFLMEDVERLLSEWDEFGTGA